MAGGRNTLLGHTNERKLISMTPTSKPLEHVTLEELIHNSVNYNVGGGVPNKGSSAVTRACRIARAYNERKDSLIGNYYGSDDSFLYLQGGDALSMGLQQHLENIMRFSAVPKNFNGENIERFSHYLLNPKVPNHQIINSQCCKIQLPEKQ